MVGGISLFAAPLVKLEQTCYNNINHGEAKGLFEIHHDQAIRPSLLPTISYQLSAISFLLPASYFILSAFNFQL
jgi:hypothetical protein